MESSRPKIELSLLGGFQAAWNGRPLTGFESVKSRALLAYLAVENGQAHSREFLAGIFWPEQPETTARKNLRQALSNLRKVLAASSPEGKNLLAGTRTSVQFNVSVPHELDVSEFQRRVAGSRRHVHRRIDACPLCVQELKQAVAIYRGDFLQEFWLNDCNRFQDWLLLHRERYHRLMMFALESLTRFHQRRGELEQAIAYLWRQVEIAPWQEEAQQTLMRLLAAAGKRSAALRQYQVCRQVLQRELGIEPAQSTEDLYRQIQKGQVAEPAIHPPDNLPLELNEFVGRQEELARVLELLNRPDCRLVTLTGSGGAGKSRLALHSAAEALFAFDDGVRYLSLAEIRTAGLIVPALAEVCSLPLSGQGDPLEQLLAFLRDKQLLLVLDNFEHLLEGVPLVQTFIRRAPGVVCLVTSRQPLNLQTEWLVKLGGLPYPPGGLSPAEAQDFPAVQLFCRRAARQQPDFRLAQNTEAVARITRLTGGLPLAIELAAGWVSATPVEEIPRRIGDSLDFLSVQFRDLPPRHRSMRAVFEQSWQTLQPEDQAVFCQLSVFSGNFTVPAGQAVAGASLHGLTRLAEKSLLERRNDGGFRLHELLRQWVKEKLCANPEEHTAVQTRHSAYYLAWLADCRAGLAGSRQAETLSAIALRLENLRQAWQWAVAHLALDEIEQALPAFSTFFELRSRTREGEDSFQLLAGQLSEQGELSGQAQRILGMALVHQGAFTLLRGAYAPADRLLQSGLKIAERQQDQATRLFALKQLSELAFRKNEYRQARKFIRQALQIAHHLDDRLEVADCLDKMGMYTMYLEEYSKAYPLHRESLALLRQIGNPHRMARALVNLANVDFGVGDYRAAQQHLQEALEICHRIGDSRLAARTLNMIGAAEVELGEFAAAEQAQLDALDIGRELGDRYRSMVSLVALAGVAYRDGRLAEAEDFARQGITLAEELENMYFRSYATYTLGEIMLEKNQAEQARAHFSACCHTLKEIGDRRGVSGALAGWGRAETALENFEQARRLFVESLRVAQQVNVLPMQCDALAGLGELAACQGDLAGAVELIALVAGHPATAQYLRQRANTLLAELQSQLDGDQAAAAISRGKAADLESSVAAWLEAAV